MTTEPNAARKSGSHPRRLGRLSELSDLDLVDKVASVMVHRLLSENPGLAAAAKVDGSVTIVEVQAREWVLPIRRAWITALFVEDAPDEVSTWPLAAEAEDAEVKPQPPRWFGFARSDAPGTKPTHRPSQDGLIDAFQSGKPVFGWSHNPDVLLPPELCRMADRVVQVPPPSPAVIAAAADVLAGAPPTGSIPEEVARATTPDHLLLAWRPGASADEVLRRLVRIVGTRAAEVDTADRLEMLLGMDEAREWGLAVARDLQDYQAGRISWADMDKAVLLAGPPGTGKSTFARRLATTCDIPLIISSPQAWQGDREGHLGHALGAMQRTFQEARNCAPCILFLDEIDSMGDRARFDERHRDYSTTYLNGLLEQLDGLQGREGVIVVAACNYPDRLDPALKRSGRLDRLLTIPLPDDRALAGILRQRLGGDLPGADLLRVVRPAIGATGADVERWVRSARRRGRHAGRPMALDDLLAEVRPKDSMHLQYRRRAAVHEAGHALVGWLDEPGSIVRASLTSGMTTGGLTEHRHEALLTRDALGRHLRRLLAGRAAEEVVFGDVSSGSGGSADSDLAKATMLAVGAITSWGLGAARGGKPLVWRGQPGPEDMRLLLAHQPNLEAEVAAMLEDAYGRARAMIGANHAAHRRIVSALMEQGVVSAEDIARLLEQAHEHDEKEPEAEAPRQVR